ncbi:sensor histidine kinase [Phenylobacterium sp.]|uniref:sensor histidine kinase n=1 Tax=Phenylobacterium sp. TaxID=1871053 RepID=UPI003566FC16
MFDTLQAIGDAQTLAQAIVNTIHEPFLVLDARLRVVAASRSFYETFQVDPEHTNGRLLYALGEGQWDIPALRVLLETIIPQDTAMDDFEVSHDFPGLGQRTMLLNARMVIYETSPDTTILLAFTDVTARRAIEREKAELLERTEELLRQKRTLLQEMEHRVANSLQIIASILLLKAKAVNSPESREHLRDAHERVMSVAAVQSHLHAVDGIEQIAVGEYLTKLCASLGASMIGGSQPPTLTVTADEGMIGSAEAVSLGLIVTELVINALKYAFPEARPDAAVRVTYENQGTGWRLTVSDNGVGQRVTGAPSAGGGLGTVIVAALVKQLEARLEVLDAPPGMSVAITRAAAPALAPVAPLAA